MSETVAPGCMSRKRGKARRDRDHGRIAIRPYGNPFQIWCGAGRNQPLPTNLSCTRRSPPSLRVIPALCRNPSSLHGTWILGRAQNDGRGEWNRIPHRHSGFMPESMLLWILGQAQNDGREWFRIPRQVGPARRHAQIRCVDMYRGFRTQSVNSSARRNTSLRTSSEI
jgi:hypothetical protein